MSFTTFVLIPGAGGDPWYWHRVVPLLERRGYETIPVRLPAADEAAGLSDYAHAVVAAIGNRDPASVVLVAQSLGGFVGSLVCERSPIGMLVFVNAMIPRPCETPGEWFATTGQAEAKRAHDMAEGRTPGAPFDPLVEFFHDVPEAVIDAAWSRGEAVQSGTVFSSPGPTKPWPDTPTRVVISRQDRFFPVEFQRRVARDRLATEADEIPGGHLAALAQPEALAMRLLSYLGVVQPAAHCAR